MARALSAKTSGRADSEIDRELHRFADQFQGVHFFCPEGGRYVVAADGKAVTCSVHGSALAPRQLLAPAGESSTDKLLRDFTGMTVTLTFLEDGLHVTVSIGRK